MSSFFNRAVGHFDKAKEALTVLADDSKRLATGAVSNLADKLEAERHSHTHKGHLCHGLHHVIHNPYHSFAPPRTQNGAKWYVDGCSYFWALSEAIESAQSQIWIMDWWLSPELYLRRPPSRWQDYRLDRMLQRAAERGVKVNVLVYKEVENVLTLSSVHTKHALEALNQNIAVFRHPDHNPNSHNLAADFKTLFSKSYNRNNLKQEGLEALSNFSDDVTLYWAHHEKLCLIDGKMAFMGGLDACFGRWDTNQHAIADAHPSNLDEIIFPGQDFNNARVFDFQDVQNWEQNKLDRTTSSRMGWSDISICLQGPIVEDLGAHFVQRWNFVWKSKYSVVGAGRYKQLSLGTSANSFPTYHPDGSNIHVGIASQKLAGWHTHAEPGPDTPVPPGALPKSDEDHHHHILDSARDSMHALESRFRRGFDGLGRREIGNPVRGINVQLVRSVSRWSHGISTEHSIANAYIEVIENSQHFIYIENQFFITATSHEQSPVKNKIGEALVDRILKAAEAGEEYKVIVLMPSVPAFAGDLHAESSMGTLAIMRFQYNSICRGGHSIIEMIEKAGVDAKQYIHFYNLRSYDRINIGAAMVQTEQSSGVSYESARKEHDDLVGAGYDGRGENTGADPNAPNSRYDKYQQSASNVTENVGAARDTVSSAYMLNGPSLTSLPFVPGSTPEIDAFVSEELYIHSKVLIADDRVVICGSANLNDRSQLGYHDSEIAVIISDPTMVDSRMNEQPYQASAFATSLRRQLFRKHLGLLPPQDPSRPDANFTPVNTNPNSYDWNSPPDLLVQDPLSPAFESLWREIASTNTSIFQHVFRPVPCDAVRTWEQYHEYYAKYFISPSPPGAKNPQPPPYKYGHVFKENFPEGEEGSKMVKELLNGVRGNLVDMPLGFLADVRDLVKEGLGYNVLTEDIYT